MSEADGIGKMDSKGFSFLKKPYSSWAPEKILAYYQNRTKIRYFPVVDEEGAKRSKIDNILRNRFEFNHGSFQLSKGFDWNDNPSQDIEWLILLHKFYYAVGLGLAYHETKDQCYVEKWIELTSSWIDSVSLDFLSSDVAGRRIQNWIFAHYYFITLSPALSIPTDFYIKLLQSIYNQVSRLTEHLTPARNHRTIELYAIFLTAVVFPEMEGSDEWLQFSKEGLLQNMLTDILPDGVHCELSTDYHHLVLKNYLNIRKLAFLNQVPIPEEMDAQIKKALDFSLYVHKPDGLIPSLSDGDVGCFLELLEEGSQMYGSEDMLYVASKGKKGTPPPFRSKGFQESGYYILRSGWGNGTEPYEEEKYLIFDCGPLGAGNHGHLDLLSIEMAAYGQSLIVDPGRYTYDESGETNWRVGFRGTAYHNTVLVDQKNQTAYCPGKKKFKIKGPEPDYELKSFVTRPGFDYLHGIARSHEYEAIHERKIFFVCPEYWLVSDLLQAKQVHDYDLLFHLSDKAFEKVSVLVEKETRLVHAPHLAVAQADCPEIILHLEAGYVSHRYGKKHPAPILRFTSRGKNHSYHTVLYPCLTQPPKISIKHLPVAAVSERSVSPLTSALCVTLTKDEETIEDLFFTSADSREKEHRFGRFQYNGRYLFARSDAEENIHRVEGEVGATLLVSGKPVSLKEDKA